jgi:hypothetical protein
MSSDEKKNPGEITAGFFRKTTLAANASQIVSQIRVQPNTGSAHMPELQNGHWLLTSICEGLGWHINLSPRKQIFICCLKIEISILSAST